jgi:hypothetical protein
VTTCSLSPGRSPGLSSVRLRWSGGHLVPPSRETINDRKENFTKERKLLIKVFEKKLAKNVIYLSKYLKRNFCQERNLLIKVSEA